MIFTEETYRFMYSALQEAEKAFEENEVPVGAVVVHNQKIIGKGYNQVERLKDATAHAEMIALTSASNNFNNWRLNECDLYVTLEPCVMCTGASLLSRVKRIFFSAFDPKYGACGSLYNIPAEGKYNHEIKIFTGIYEKESKELLQNFFLNKRKNDK